MQKIKIISEATLPNLTHSVNEFIQNGDIVIESVSSVTVDKTGYSIVILYHYAPTRTSPR